MLAEEIILAPVVTEKSNDELQQGKYTFRVNKNATILQLIPFNNKEDTMNFLYQEKQLTLLDKDMKPIKSELNYTLKKVE